MKRKKKKKNPKCIPWSRSEILKVWKLISFTFEIVNIEIMNRRELHFILSSLLLCYALQLARCQTDAYHCVWRGNCGVTNFGVSRTCASNDPPKPIDFQSNSNLREKCPYYFEGKGIFSQIYSNRSLVSLLLISFLFPS